MKIRVLFLLCTFLLLTDISHASHLARIKCTVQVQHTDDSGSFVNIGEPIQLKRTEGGALIASINSEETGDEDNLTVRVKVNHGSKNISLRLSTDTITYSIIHAAFYSGARFTYIRRSDKYPDRRLRVTCIKLRDLDAKKKRK